MSSVTGYQQDTYARREQPVPFDLSPNAILDLMQFNPMSIATKKFFQFGGMAQEGTALRRVCNFLVEREKVALMCVQRDVYILQRPLIHEWKRRNWQRRKEEGECVDSPEPSLPYLPSVARRLTYIHSSWHDIVEEHYRQAPYYKSWSKVYPALYEIFELQHPLKYDCPPDSPPFFQRSRSEVLEGVLNYPAHRCDNLSPFERCAQDILSLIFAFASSDSDNVRWGWLSRSTYQTIRNLYLKDCTPQLSVEAYNWSKLRLLAVSPMAVAISELTLHGAIEFPLSGGWDLRPLRSLKKLLFSHHSSILLKLHPGAETPFSVQLPTSLKHIEMIFCCRPIDIVAVGDYMQQFINVIGTQSLPDLQQLRLDVRADRSFELGMMNDQMRPLDLSPLESVAPTLRMLDLIVPFNCIHEHIEQLRTFSQLTYLDVRYPKENDMNTLIPIDWQGRLHLLFNNVEKPMELEEFQLGRTVCTAPNITAWMPWLSNLRELQFNYIPHNDVDRVTDCAFLQDMKQLHSLKVRFESTDIALSENFVESITCCREIRRLFLEYMQIPPLQLNGLFKALPNLAAFALFQVHLHSISPFALDCVLDEVALDLTEPLPATELHYLRNLKSIEYLDLRVDFDPPINETNEYESFFKHSLVPRCDEDVGNLRNYFPNLNYFVCNNHDASLGEPADAIEVLEV